MENNFYTPVQIVENGIKIGITKANLNLFKMILKSIFAGMFIALGAVASNLAVHNITDVGIARTLSGVIFPVGLMMVIILGGELFTGNCLISLAFFDKKISLIHMLRNLIVVYFSNMIGTILIAYLVFYSGHFEYSNGGLGAYTIKVAMGKAGMDFSNALFSGILCNILVCSAVLMTIAAKDIIGKIFGAFFPIMIFVISGYEHCGANKYYIPAGMIASTNPKYVEKACELYGFTPEQIKEQLTNSKFFGANLIPVTIGNLIGGIFIVSLGLYVITKLKDKENNRAENRSK